MTHLKFEPTIPLADCKPRVAYRLFSRNLAIGVFDPEAKGFIGIRTKFGSRYLATEYHYDTGAPFGTAAPKEELRAIPTVMQLQERPTDDALFKWLEALEAELGLGPPHDPR